MFILVSAPGRAAFAAASFQGLGDLPGGEVVSRVRDVSADGSVVVGVSTSSAGSQTFRWTLSGGMAGLPAVGPDVIYYGGFGTSADGSAVVGALRNVSGAKEAFRWTSGGGVVGLGGLSGIGSAGHDVSDDASVIVGEASVAGIGDQAFRWTSASGMANLGTLPDYDTSTATGVSADGRVVIGHATRRSDFTNQLFRWTPETGMVGLGFLPGGNDSSAARVSDDGSTIVGGGSSETFHRAFRWQQDTGMVSLGVLPGHSWSFAQDTSGDGSIVVGFSSPGGTEEETLFIWSEGRGMFPLADVLTAQGADLTGWTLLDPQSFPSVSISADGRTLVGDGTNPSGQWEAWVATLDPTAIPEPAGLALFILPASLLAARVPRRRWQRTG